MSRQWTTDLRPLKTDFVKEYLTDAPYLIIVFKQVYGMIYFSFFLRTSLDQVYGFVFLCFFPCQKACDRTAPNNSIIIMKFQHPLQLGFYCVHCKVLD